MCLRLSDSYRETILAQDSDRENRTEKGDEERGWVRVASWFVARLNRALGPLKITQRMLITLKFLSGFLLNMLGRDSDDVGSPTNGLSPCASAAAVPPSLGASNPMAGFKLFKAQCQIGWSERDERVSLAAALLGLPKPRLSGEVGFAAEVLESKRQRLQTFFAEPSQVGRSDFIMGAVGQNTVAHHAPSLPVLPIAVRRLKLMSCHISSDDLVFKCQGMTRTFLESDFNATALGAVLHEQFRSLADEGILQQTIRGAFAKKAVATLYKRTLAFWAFFQKKAQTDYHKALWFGESDVYGYVCDLRDQGRAATAGQSFIESLIFFQSIVGFRAMQANTVVSPRVQGAVHSMLVTKRNLTQARPLTVKDVKGLESLVVDGDSTHKANMAGFFSSHWLRARSLVMRSMQKTLSWMSQKACSSFWHPLQCTKRRPQPSARLLCCL